MAKIDLSLCDPNHYFFFSSVCLLLLYFFPLPFILLKLPSPCDQHTVVRIHESFFLLLNLSILGIKPLFLYGILYFFGFQPSLQSFFLYSPKALPGALLHALYKRSSASSKFQKIFRVFLVFFPLLSIHCCSQAAAELWSPSFLTFLALPAVPCPSSPCSWNTHPALSIPKAPFFYAETFTEDWGDQG